MTVGASLLINSWGRPMSLSRAGVVLLASFKARRAEIRPSSEELDQSVEQHNFKIIALAEDFGAVRPVKFDKVTDLTTLEVFTVERGHAAGAETDEVIKMVVKGGNV